VVDEPETQRQAEILRGLLYLACPGAPTAALEDTGAAVAQRSAAAGQPARAVPEADRLAAPRPGPDRARDLRHAVLSGGDLTSADLRGANLSGADLSHADLHVTNLADADLSSANLFWATLKETRLSGANLSRADLSGAQLSGTPRARMDLSGVDLSRTNLSAVRMSHVNLTGANLSHANLSGANLSHTDLSGADLSHTDLAHALLAGTVVLSGANLAGADLVYVRELPLVPGIEWDAGTRWPPDFGAEIRRLSDEVRPGVFRVRDPAAGTDRTGPDGRRRPGHAGG
jgi:hypothetical protein